MDFSSTNPSGSSPAVETRATENLVRNFDRLHFLFVAVTAALLLLSLGANLFIGQQMRLVRMQLPAQRDAVIRLSLEFQKRDEPVVRNFVARLQDFAASNADFDLVLEQYRPPLGVYFRSGTAKPVGSIPQAPATNSPWPKSKAAK